jgi:hypothetical protein
MQEPIDFQALLDVFEKCILLRENEANPLVSFEDIADIVSLGRYVRWSLAAPLLSEKILKLQSSGKSTSSYSHAFIYILRRFAWRHYLGPSSSPCQTSA